MHVKIACTLFCRVPVWVRTGSGSRVGQGPVAKGEGAGLGLVQDPVLVQGGADTSQGAVLFQGDADTSQEAVLVQGGADTSQGAGLVQGGADTSQGAGLVPEGDQDQDLGVRQGIRM